MFRYLSSVGFPLAIFAALAALSLWLRHAIELPETGRDGKGRHDPDYIIHDFRMIKLSPTGVPHHTLRASKLIHYPDDDSTAVERPQLASLPAPKGSAGSPTVTMQAKAARLSADGTEVQLQGDVQLERSPIGARALLRAEMDTLTVFPEAEKATTEAAVRLSEGGSRLNGTGMDVDQKAQTFVLRSQVTGTFVPKHGPQQ